jgi:hypothetical protein
MATSTYKAVAAQRELVDILKKQLTTMPVLTESFDSNGNPVAIFSADSTPAFGEKVVVIRCKAIAAIGQVNSIGQTQDPYSHHVFQICTELNFAGVTDNVADILTAVEILPILSEVGRRGSFVEWHQTANGTVPSVAAIDAGTNLKATWRNLYWNVLSAS